MWLMKYRNLPTITRFPVLSSSLFDDFFESNLVSSATGIDMYEEGENLIIQTLAPGFNEEDLEIDLDNRVLTIRGNVKSETIEDAKKYYLKEMKQESFQRSVQLPVSVNEETVEADYKDGVVTVRLEKQPEPGKKKILLKRG